MDPLPRPGGCLEEGEKQQHLDSMPSRARSLSVLGDLGIPTDL